MALRQAPGAASRWLQAIAATGRGAAGAAWQPVRQASRTGGCLHVGGALLLALLAVPSQPAPAASPHPAPAGRTGAATTGTLRPLPATGLPQAASNQPGPPPPGSFPAADAAERGSSQRPGPVTPVASVDLERYAGFWYEIARVPAWFQNRCARRSIARYELRADGRIAVLNQCLKRNGNAEQAEGVARVVDPATNARLRVSLVSLLGWRPFWGDYWVIGLDPDYRWAVVGDPQRRYGWILSRTPSLQPDTLEGIFQLLERNGYGRSRFVLTPQSP